MQLRIVKDPLHPGWRLERRRWWGWKHVCSKIDRSLAEEAAAELRRGRIVLSA